MTTNEFLGERTRERDRFELDLGDAFDVKASIVLMILTFLGTNRTKAWSLNGAFWFMALALFVELGVLAYIAFAIRPS
jgi:hypothetical protein